MLCAFSNFFLSVHSLTNKPGHAMKGSDDKVRLGNVLGKAMEPFRGKGTGVIKVLVGKY